MGRSQFTQASFPWSEEHFLAPTLIIFIRMLCHFVIVNYIHGHLGEVPLPTFPQHGLLLAVSRFRVDYVPLRLVSVQETGKLTNISEWGGLVQEAISCV